VFLVCLPLRLLPPAAQMLPVLQHFMQHPGKEHLLCRCRAVEAAGIVVSTLGAKDPVIGPHIAPMMEAVLAGMLALEGGLGEHFCWFMGD
jgi:hypothetical protein